MSAWRDDIILRGLKENNLKNIDLDIPKGKLIVFAGVSGSGKSSVVFDTIAAESRRQMTLNYPLYVRNQMPRYERPQADLMQNLSPVVVVEQRQIGGSSRSTVGTYMDIDPLLRLLFSRMGQPSIGSATDFSNHSNFGRCPTCTGLGEVITPDIQKLVDFKKTLRENAIQFKPLSTAGWQGRWIIDGGLFDPDKPIDRYTEAELRLLLDGPPAGERVFAPFHTKNGPQPHEWDGLVPRFKRLYINRDITKLKEVSESDILAVSHRILCPDCAGTGLHQQVLACKINGWNIAQFGQLELTDVVNELRSIDDPLGASIARQALIPVQQLVDVGLGYLSLARTMDTLSGGEGQRVKIVRQLGSSLNNIVYIFDEPSAGLHPEEVAVFLQMLQKIKANFNTVIVIEHDPYVIAAADEIIEMGPGAGVHGGEIVFQGTMEAWRKLMLAKRRDDRLVVNRHPRQAASYFHITNANEHNLKQINVDIPKQLFVTICGRSGSGKSTLMFQSFVSRYPSLIAVGQGGIGTSTRSTLATYMGIMDEMRAALAKESGQPAGLFSFNSLGACPVCNGKGITTPDVAFADPVTITCESCNGTRYSEEALQYRYHQRNIVEMLQLTADEVADVLPIPAIIKRAQMLQEVGLGYLTLGQTTSSLSGGEVQRLKLASHLQKSGQVYILDEPSLGLHYNDSMKLLQLFQKIVDQGNSVIIIDHQLDFIAVSDWVIELGPGSGKDGGQVIFEGTPAELLLAETATAKWLRNASQ